MLRWAAALVEGMTYDREQMACNLDRYDPFAATERVLTAAVRAGADRQAAHKWLRELSLQAWESVRRDEANPFLDLLIDDARLADFLPSNEVRRLMNAGQHGGTAVQREGVGGSNC